MRHCGWNPTKPRRLAAATLVAGALLAGATATAADTPLPAGRYRCYQPPAFTVTAWFDLEANGTYRVNGGKWQRYAFDAEKSLVRWSGSDFAAGQGYGVFIPPGGPGGEEARHTIVLSGRADARPGMSGWARLERCYMTTH